MEDAKKISHKRNKKSTIMDIIRVIIALVLCHYHLEHRNEVIFLQKRFTTMFCVLLLMGYQLICLFLMALDEFQTLT